MTDRPVPAIPLKQRREQTIEQLCVHFAADRLEMSDFEARLDQANRAATSAELDALLQDLPARAPPPPAPAQVARDAVQRGARAVGATIRESQTLVAIMGGVERRGPWTPARKNLVIAVMGGADLDFRQVDLPPGETEIQIFCMMGGVDIVVPPDLAVDASGFAIMGGFGHASAPQRPEPGAPVLRITGFCVMGGVDISVRRAGESARDARVRQRAERKELRDRDRRQIGGEG